MATPCTHPPMSHYLCCCRYSYIVHGFGTRNRPTAKSYSSCFAHGHVRPPGLLLLGVVLELSLRKSTRSNSMIGKQPLWILSDSAAMKSSNASFWRAQKSCHWRNNRMALRHLPLRCMAGRSCGVRSKPTLYNLGEDHPRKGHVHDSPNDHHDHSESYRQFHDLCFRRALRQLRYVLFLIRTRSFQGDARCQAIRA